MESVELPQLPSEIHRHILSFLPHQDLKNAMLVNRDYYSYCSKALSFKQTLTINKKILNDKSVVVSMKHTLRRFKNVIIEVDDFNEWELNRLQSIFDNIGGKITNFYISALAKQSIVIEQTIVMKWVNAMPELEILNSGGLYSCKEVANDYESKLNLPKLREVRLCPLAIGLKLHLTPKSSLEVLTLNDKFPLYNISRVFKAHGDTLKKLILFRPVYADPQPFRQLKLNEFQCLYQEYYNNKAHNEFLADVLQHQTQLEILILGECDLCSNCYPVNSQLLRFICNQLNVKKLAIGFNNDLIQRDVFEMRKLVNLQKLILQLDFMNFTVSREIIEAFANTKIPSLKHLRIEPNEAVTSDIIRSMGESFPNLTKFAGDFNTDENDAINIILDSFSKLTTLKVNESGYIFTPGRSYPNMKKLVFWSEGGPVDVSPELIKSMPNLHEIQIEEMFPRFFTMKAILRSKIKCVDITISHCEEYVSAKQVRKLEKIASRIMEKGENYCVTFLDDDHTYLLDLMSFD